MNNITYIGPFKDHIHNYVKLKQAVGYKFETDASHLKRFDRFTLEKYPETTVLTKEIVLDWCSKKTYEAQANQCSRASNIRQFGKYLDSIGVNAYIIPKAYFPTEKQYMPYIYTIDELTRFFAQTDKPRKRSCISKLRLKNQFKSETISVPIDFQDPGNEITCSYIKSPKW